MLAPILVHVLIFYVALSIILVSLAVGKSRRPITPAASVGVTIVGALQIIALVYVYFQL